MIAIVDYGRGNLFSIGQALTHIGAPHEITSDPGRVAAAERLILPGVGAFGDAMSNLRERSLIAPILEAANRGAPLLGICLGMQFLADRSEEFGSHAGLGLIPGVVRRLPEGTGDNATRIPNVGWRALARGAEHRFTAALAAETSMYFVHSYAPFPTRADTILATIPVNGIDVPAIIGRDRIVGCQFHPEKSGEAGLALLRRFAEWPA